MISCKYPFYLVILTIFTTGSSGTRFHGAALNRIHLAEGFYRFPSTSFEHCYRLCIYAKICESSNWLSSKRECQLNLRDPDSTGSIQLSAGSVHVSAFTADLKGNPCSNEPCSPEHMCVPVTKETDYRCLRIFKTAERRADTSTSSSETASTTQTSATSSTALSSHSDTTATRSETITSTETATSLPSATTTTTTTSTTITTSSLSNYSTPSTISTMTSSTTSPSPSTTTSASASTTTTSPTSTTESPTSEETTTPATTTLPSTDCTVTADCSPFPDTICLETKCACAVGFDFDRQRGECRTMAECVVFGTEFTCYAGYYITSNNEATYSLNHSECEQKCLASSSFTCKSYETYYSSCYLQSVTWADVSEDLRIVGSNVVQHCQRSCNWT